MRRNASRMAMLLILAFARPALAEELLDDYMSVLQPTSSSFRFSDEEPAFEEAGAEDMALSSCYDSGLACDTCASSCCCTSTETPI